MNCLVLGGTGTVGSLVAHELAAHDHAVRVATRNPSRVRSLPRGAQAVALDIRHLQPSDLAGADRVFCMLPRGLSLSEDQVKALFAALSTARVGRVVLMTGLGVDRAIGSPLERLEQALQKSVIPYTIVRPNYMFQNLSSGAIRESIVDRDEIALPAGDSRASYVDARDVAEVAARALVCGGEECGAVDLTGPAAISYAEIAQVIGSAVRRPLAYRDLSEEQARAESLAAGVPGDVIDARLAFLSLAKRGLFAEITDGVERLLGRSPRSLEVFVLDHVFAWKKKTP